jgi:hypothetical protein
VITRALLVVGWIVVGASTVFVGVVVWASIRQWWIERAKDRGSW